MQPQHLFTDRLILVPFTLQMVCDILAGDFTLIEKEGLNKGNGWPDEDALETLPKIQRNLEDSGGAPSGFESWMIVKKEGKEIIGSAGFKGRPDAQGAVDIGYGLIVPERRKGFAVEATQMLVQWACAQPGVKKVTARCLTNNFASAAVLQKLNFEEQSRDEEMIYWLLQP
ncbi:MAG: GNAT family N-acetyltransferase [Chitinophagaceae bacterium]